MDLKNGNIVKLEQQLNSFDASERRQALVEIAGMIKMGDLNIPEPKDEVNLHYHTFFSFNANGWSPGRIAWEARKYGLKAAGIVDFDVLDGMEEFLSAGELLGIKAAAGLESRVFISEYADKVMSSPNEPGIAYFMATGCFKLPEVGSEAERILNSMRNTAKSRNLRVMERVNVHLPETALDYDNDVMPLTPSGNATERHLLAAYDRKSRQTLGDMAPTYWGKALGMTPEEAFDLMNDTPKFHEKMRSKLMKYGGVAYVVPDSGSFPSIEETISMILGIDALPTITWLDGVNPGESDMMAFLDLLEPKGVVAMNIIPDRNWNIKDTEEKKLKVAKLGEAVEAARAHNFPIIVGTEMNKAGLPFVDNFQAPELKPYVEDFLRGAAFLYGHTLLARHADFGFFSDGAKAAFGDDRKAKNDFFEKAGSFPIPDESKIEKLKADAGKLEPGKILEILGK